MMIDLPPVDLACGIALLAVVVTALLGLIRNERVSAIKMAFLYDAALWPDAYDALPGYSAMVNDLRYWHLWTKRQWVEWARRSMEAQ